MITVSNLVSKKHLLVFLTSVSPFAFGASEKVILVGSDSNTNGAFLSLYSEAETFRADETLLNFKFDKSALLNLAQLQAKEVIEEPSQSSPFTRDTYYKRSGFANPLVVLTVTYTDREIAQDVLVKELDSDSLDFSFEPKSYVNHLKVRLQGIQTTYTCSKETDTCVFTKRADKSSFGNSKIKFQKEGPILECNDGQNYVTVFESIASPQTKTVKHSDRNGNQQSTDAENYLGKYRSSYTGADIANSGRGNFAGIEVNNYGVYEYKLFRELEGLKITKDVLPHKKCFSRGGYGNLRTTLVPLSDECPQTSRYSNIPAPEVVTYTGYSLDWFYSTCVKL